MKKFKIGDKLIRNKKKLATIYDKDPRIIKLVDIASMQKGDNINGFKFKDVFTGKTEDDTTEYIECYYEIDQRKEKLLKLKLFTDEEEKS